MQLATNAASNTCKWQHVKLATHATGNTRNWQHVELATRGTGNKCKWQQVKLTTCAIGNTCSLQHVQFATHVLCNTCTLQHIHFAKCALWNTWLTFQFVHCRSFRVRRRPCFYINWKPIYMALFWAMVPIVFVSPSWREIQKMTLNQLKIIF